MQGMKKVVGGLALLSALVAASPARAEEKMLGTVTDIEMSNPKTAVATLADRDSGKPVQITVVDQVTLDKFQDHRISVGDEIKCKYEKKDGKNVATYFKKPGGC